MKERFPIVLVIIIVALQAFPVCAPAQSIADIARDKRQASTAQKATRVFTNLNQDAPPNPPQETPSATPQDTPEKPLPNEPAPSVAELAEAKQTLENTTSEFETVSSFILDLEKQIPNVDDPQKVQYLKTQLDSLKQNVNDWTKQRKDAQKVIERAKKASASLEERDPAKLDEPQRMAEDPKQHKQF